MPRKIGEVDEIHVPVCVDVTYDEECLVGVDVLYHTNRGTARWKYFF